MNTQIIRSIVAIFVRVGGNFNKVNFDILHEVRDFIDNFGQMRDKISTVLSVWNHVNQELTVRSDLKSI